MEIKMKKAVILALGTAVAFPAVSVSAHADRDPTAGERAHIAGALRAKGFTSWERIELDDGRWEVDDARHVSGRVYDLDLAPGSLRVIKRDLE
jgi:hypothetical protein